MRDKVEEVISTLSQYKHISNFLELESDDTQNATIRITVEYNNQVYEHLLTGEMSTIQEFTSKVIEKAGRVRLLWNVAHVVDRTENSKES